VRYLVLNRTQSHITGHPIMLLLAASADLVFAMAFTWHSVGDIALILRDFNDRLWSCWSSIFYYWCRCFMELDRQSWSFTPILLADCHEVGYDPVHSTSHNGILPFAIGTITPPVGTAYSSEATLQSQVEKVIIRPRALSLRAFQLALHLSSYVTCPSPYSCQKFFGLWGYWPKTR